MKVQFSLLFNIIALYLFNGVWAQVIPGPYESHELNGTMLSVTDAWGNKQIIQAYSATIIKIHYLMNGDQEEPSPAVVLFPDPGIPVGVDEDEEQLSYLFSGAEIRISKDDLSVRIIRSGTFLLEEKTIHIGPETPNITLHVEAAERLMGSGSRAIPLDLRNRVLDIYNQSHYGYGWEEPDMNICIPYLVSTAGFSVFFDNHRPASLDLSMPGTISYQAGSGPTRYWVMLDEDQKGILSDMARLTGHQPMPPRWALGYIQSRFGYQDREEAESVVDAMISQGFPLDALVLDLYWQGDVGEMGNLEWDWSRFPVPQSMVSDLDQQGIKTILITDPYVTQASFNYNSLDASGFFCTDPGGETYVLDNFWAGPAGLLDLNDEDAWGWFWERYRSRADEGIGGWWCDLGEPELHPADMLHGGLSADDVHNVYSLNWAKKLYESYRENYPEQRLFNLIRSGYAGMQRYSTFPWSADVQRSFDGMRAQVPIVLSMGLCGVPFMHYDMCGFTGAIDEEVYTRWFQMGTFAPVMRSHGTGSPPEPIFRSENTKEIVREYARLRHQMMPYNYTLAWEAATTGVPPARPMFFYDDGELAWDFMDYQYFWGESFLIAPVFNPDQTTRYTYLPQGKWIDFHSDLTYYGGMILPLPSPLADMPVLVKAGSVIPLVTDYQSIKDYSTEHLQVQLYPDPQVTDADFTMYDDDGESPNALIEEEFELLRFVTKYTNQNFEMDLTKLGSYEGAPVLRTIELVLHRCLPAQSIERDGIALSVSGTMEEYLMTDQAWFSDVDNDRVLVKYPWDGSPTHVGIMGLEVVERFASLEEKMQPTDMRVFPVPAVDRLNLEIVLPEETGLDLLITDLSGKVCLSERSHPKGPGIYTGMMDIRALTPGVYLFSIQGDHFKVTRKLIVGR